jgi:reactive intermediate/imine deaminase
MIRYSERPLPASGGHYSHCVVAGGFSFISGQLPMLPDGNLALASEAFDQQFQQVLANLTSVLRNNNLSVADIVKVTIYVADIASWRACNEIYASYFGAFKPARTIVPVAPLHFGFKVELDAVAYREVS